MNIEWIKARDLPDAWFQCVYHIFDKGYEYTIDRGSFKGQKRIEYDYIVVHISHPGTRPSSRISPRDVLSHRPHRWNMWNSILKN